MTASPFVGASRPSTLVQRLSQFHSRSQRRLAAVAGALTVILAFLMAVDVVLGGSAEVGLRDVVPAMLGQRDGLTHFVVFDTRMPRAVAAALVGAMFGTAGHLYQRLVGNPLATPDIIGISAGAGAAAVAVIALGVTGIGVQAAAIVGAVVVASAIFALSARGGIAPYRLVLIGIGIGALASAATTYLLTVADKVTMEVALRWMVGSLNGVSWRGAGVLAVAGALGAVAVILVGAMLRMLAVGEDLAAGLGVSVGGVRVAALVIGAILAAIATSIAGPIAFVALVSGPIAARLIHDPDRPFFAGLVGAVLVVAADILAQNAPLISPVPTGAIAAVIGAPALIYLLVRHRRTS